MQVHEKYLEIYFDSFVTFESNTRYSATLKEGPKNPTHRFETIVLDKAACCFADFATDLKDFFLWAAGFPFPGSASSGRDPFYPHRGRGQHPH